MGEHAKPSDIIRLNVRGTEFFARRDTLTVMKGSRLEAVFSGRWENQLLRDESGRVFMDVDPSIFKRILDYLCVVKIADDAPPLPEVVDEADKAAFDMYVDYLKIRNSASPKAAANEETVSSTMAEKEMMSKMRQELNTIERDVENEDSCVAFFTKESDVIEKSTSNKCDDSSCFSYKSDGNSSTESKKSSTFEHITASSICV